MWIAFAFRSAEKFISEKFKVDISFACIGYALVCSWCCPTLQNYKYGLNLVARRLCFMDRLLYFINQKSIKNFNVVRCHSICSCLLSITVHIAKHTKIRSLSTLIPSFVLARSPIGIYANMQEHCYNSYILNKHNIINSQLA